MRRDYEQLMSLQSLMIKNDEQSKLVKALESCSGRKTERKYAALTVEEIKELLVNKKWYYSIYDGIDALYVAISHNITDRVVELAERYEDTLPALSALVEDYESKVKISSGKDGICMVKPGYKQTEIGVIPEDWI